jgi:parallel beta-helix repeat protein
MLRQLFYGLLFMPLLIALFALPSNIRGIEASGTIYIRSDGSIEGTDKIHRVGSTYTFADNLTNPIVVEKSDIVIDGAGKVLEGMANGTGISLSNVENVTIRKMTIRTFENGITLAKSSTCNISENNITMSFSHGIILNGSSTYNNILGNAITSNKYDGIYIASSAYNTISGNTISANYYDGFVLSLSKNNILSGNHITANGEYGVVLLSSDNNIVSGNDITANSKYGVVLLSSSNNSISRNNMANNYGFLLQSSSNNNVTGNTITKNEYGIVFMSSSNNNGANGNTITANTYYGIFLMTSSGNTLSGNNIGANGYDGIHLDYSSNNSIERNNVATNNEHGINLYNFSDHNKVFGNNITANDYGVVFYYSANSNSVSGNAIEINNIGIVSQDSSNNTVYRNNFLNNTDSAFTENSTDSWDNGYPSGGNYWDDYEGEDHNGDGIGDTPYTVDASNTDRYPHIVPLDPILIFWKGASCYCLIAGNVTVSRFYVSQQKEVSLKTTGLGYVNLTFPREFLDGSFRVLVNDTQMPWLSSWNGTQTSIYFECKTSSSQSVRIEAQTKLQGDINCDGSVNIVDVSIVARNFGQKLNP